MFPSYASSSSSMISQTLLDSIKYRKLLIQPPSSQPLAQSSDVAYMFSGTRSTHQLPFERCNAGGSFDTNIAVILAVFLCALICALGLTSASRCALQCSRRRRPAHGSQEQIAAARAANTGLKRKTVMSLPTLLYSTNPRLSGSDPLCAICLSEFVAGDQVRVLPNCNHGFHVNCIDTWLVLHSCRHCLLAPNQKPIPCNHARQVEIPQPSDPEGSGLVFNYGVTTQL